MNALSKALGRYATLLRERPSFRALWLAQTISLIGDWFNVVASVAIINHYTETGTGTALSGVFLARALPPFLMNPIVGVVADRFDRRKVLVASDLFRVLIVLGFLLVTSAERVWLIYVLSALQFTVGAFFEPARAALLPGLVEENEILPANALMNTTWSVMATLGAGLGGLITAAFGPTTALVIDSGTFGLSAAVIIWLVGAPRVRATVGDAVRGSGWSEFVAGLRYVWQRPLVGLYASVKGLGQFGTGDIVYSVMAATLFNFGDDGAGALGLLYMAFGIGTALGPLLGDVITRDEQPRMQGLIAAGFVLTIIGWFLLGLSPILSLAMGAVFVRGLGISVNWTTSSVLLQLNVPDNYLGRVAALDFAIFTLVQSVSILLTGLAIDRLQLSGNTVAQYISLLSLIPLAIWLLALRRGRQETAEGTT